MKIELTFAEEVILGLDGEILLKYLAFFFEDHGFLFAYTVHIEEEMIEIAIVWESGQVALALHVDEFGKQEASDFISLIMDDYGKQVEHDNS